MKRIVTSILIFLMGLGASYGQDTLYSTYLLDTNSYKQVIAFNHKEFYETDKVNHPITTLIDRDNLENYITKNQWEAFGGISYSKKSNKAIKRIAKYLKQSFKYYDTLQVRRTNDIEIYGDSIEINNTEAALFLVCGRYFLTALEEGKLKIQSNSEDNLTFLNEQKIIVKDTIDPVNKLQSTLTKLRFTVPHSNLEYTEYTIIESN